MADPVVKGLVSLAPDTEGLKKSLGGLGAELKGTFSKLGGGLGDLLSGDVKGALSKLSSSVGKEGGVLSPLTAGIAGAAAGAGVALFQLGSEFDKTYKSIQKSTGATGKDLDALKESFKAVATQTGASFENISTAVSEVSKRTGATGSDLESLSLQMLRLSSVTGVDLNTAIEKGTKAFNNWGISAADMPAALDKLYVASTKSGLSVDSLMEAAQRSGPIMRQFGLSFDQSVGLLVAFEKAGLDGAKMTAALNKAITTAAKEGKELPAFLEDTVNKIKGAGSAAEANGLAIKAFGGRAGPQLAEAIRNGTISLEDFNAGLGDTDGALKQVAGETATFSGKMAKFKNQMKVAFEPVAMGLFDAITGALLKVTPYLTMFANFVSWVIKNIPGMKVVMGALVGVVVALTVAIAAQAAITKIASLSLGAKTVGEVAAAVATKALAAAQWLLNAAMSANPIALVVIAIVALVAAIVLLWVKCEGFRNIVKAVFEAAKNAVGVFVDAAVEGFKWVMNAISSVWDFVKEYWPLLVGMLGGPIGLAVAAIVKYWDQVKEVIDKVVGWFKEMPGKIVAGLGELGSLLLGWITDAWNWVESNIGGAIAGVLAWFGGLPGRFVGALGDLGGALTGWVRKAFDGLLEGIRTAINGVINWVKSNWKTLLVAALLAPFIGPGSIVFLIINQFDGLKTFFFKTVPGWLKQLPGQLLGAIGNLGSFLLPDLSALEDLPRTVGRLITDVVNTIKALPKQMVGALSGLGASVSKTVKDALSSVTNVLGGLGGSISGALKGLPGQITGALGGLNGVLKNMGSQMMGALSNGMRDASKWVTDVAKSLPGAVQGALGNVGQWLFSSGQKVIGGLTNGIKAALGWIGSALGAVKGAAQGAVGSAINWLYGRGTDIIRGIANGIRDALAFVRGALGAVKGAAQGAISGAVNWLYSSGRAIIQGVINGVGAMVGAVRTAAKNAAYNGAKQAMVGAFGWLVSSGRAIIQGLINGILSMVGAVRNAVNSVINAAKKLLPFSEPKDRSSPLAGRGSTFYSGISIASQLAEGITAATPLVAAAAEGMAEAAGGGLGANVYDLSAVGAGMAAATSGLGGGAPVGGQYTLEMHVSEADTSQLQAGFRRLELLSGAA